MHNIYKQVLIKKDQDSNKGRISDVKKYVNPLSSRGSKIITINSSLQQMRTSASPKKYESPSNKTSFITQSVINGRFKKKQIEQTTTANINEAPPLKEYGFSNKLANAQAFQIEEIIQKRRRRNRLKRANESFTSVIKLNDQSEELLTQTQEQYKDLDQQKKMKIASLIENTSIKNSFIKPIDKMSRFDYYSQYKDFDKIEEFNKRFQLKERLNVRILEKYSEQSLTPRRCNLIGEMDFERSNSVKGIVKMPTRQGIFSQNQSFETSKTPKSLSLGDRYAKICSSALDDEELTSKRVINLHNNRLTSKGIKFLADNLPEKIEVLDLSNNYVDSIGCKYLEHMLQEKHIQQKSNNPIFNLQNISLENSRINDYGAISLCQALFKFQYLKKLNLSKNFIGDVGCESLGQLLVRNRTITEIYLHWNRVRSRGGAELFRGLSKNDILKVLDLSFNSMGHEDSLLFGEKNNPSETLTSNEETQSTFNLRRTAVKEIANYFQKQDSQLMHLDLSFNKFTSDNMKLLSSAINQNQTLIGLHIEGNSKSYVSVDGFILKSSQTTRLELKVNQKKLIQGVQVLGLNMLQNSQYNRLDNCWVCEGFYEHQFIIRNEQIEQIYVHLSYDSWQPILMEQDESEQFWYLRKMCPPYKKIYFFFSIPSKQQHLTSSDYSKEEIQTYLENLDKKNNQITYKDQENNLIQVENLDHINFMLTGQNSTIDPLTYFPLIETFPRHSRQVLTRTGRNSIINKHWSLENSNFTRYIRDSEELSDRCFENDWSLARIVKWVKPDDEIPMVKRLFRTNFFRIKELYRQYSAYYPINGLPGMSYQACLELAYNLGFIDNSSLKIQDVESIFNLINSKELKFPMKNEAHIVRFQIMEFLFKLSEIKYFRLIGSRTYLDTVSKLFDELSYKVADIETPQGWRERKYWNQGCDFIIRLQHINLKMIFQHFKQYDENTKSRMFLTLDNFKHGLEHFGLIDKKVWAAQKPVTLTPGQRKQHRTELVRERDFNLIFFQSIMSQIDEVLYSQNLNISQIMIGIQE